MNWLIVVATLLSVLAVVSSAQSVPSDSHPLLFVSKSVSDDYVVVGNNVEFTVTVYNYGQSPAADVTITDVLVDGSVRTKHIDMLSFGESAVLKYTVTPKELGSYATDVAQVTYALQKGKPATEKAYSNMIREGNAYFLGEGYDDESFRGVVSVVTRDRYDRLHKRYIREFVAYAFLCVVPAVFPLVMYRTVQNQVDLLIRRSKMSK
ncbi:translocon-associated protein subunit beta [Trypanosoma theileri]|uniref:Translocon-associated protein subunit beta n=1 Tax=Trypanosoma theileri TaxID=67003 RepID=A0A1X0P213_9TRYP|nr:translocon-associated protein subunit beta [Trypanosoma theileri]ORC90743.1 translocon-associated protein subunit beta [Trypanosoma theileri]